ncbi:hypothetical protein ACWDSD_12565 [Streptomyces spiralis]|uniref:hypothetical protein n=1 Tax=Streptomyces spiralis TaxID=66376 RepID=UPI00167B884D|nr:hypothetical protein [Streptomyces spiralis]
MINGLKRAVALGAATVALAAGAVVGTVGTASAAPQHHQPPRPSRHCVESAGHWTWVRHSGFRDRHHRWHAAYWTRVWQPTHHRNCHR